MTTLTVKNYRGIADASIDIEPIALVAGKNGAGKSSIAQAAGAVMTANPAPIDGFKKNEARQLIRDGADKGRAELGGASLTLPGGSSSGQGPRGSAVAAGLDHPLDMRPADAAKYLSRVLRAEPTREDLAAALPDIPKKTLDAIWSSIENVGWDKAHDRGKERGASLKGEWKAVTGINYGTKVADGWVPPELPTPVPSREDLQARHEKAVKVRDELVSQRAVSADVMERNRKLAAELDAWKAEFQTAQENVELLTAKRDPLAQAYAEAEEHADSLPQPGEVPVTAECPECGTHLVVVSKTELTQAQGGPDKAENERRTAAIAEADAAVKKAAEGLRKHDDELTRARDQKAWAERQIAAAEQARQALSEAPEGGATDEQIDAATEAVDEAAYHLSRLDDMERATGINKSIGQAADIVRALAPEGVRQAVLAERLDDVNGRMADLCNRADYPVVQVTNELEFTLNGRPYRLLSESEQYRVRVVSQIVISQIDGSQFIVIDRADLLDRQGRNGLFKMVMSTGVEALICMTMDDIEDIPAKLRQRVPTYWVEDGSASRA